MEESLSQATEVLDWLSAATAGAIGIAEGWAWFLFAAFAVFRVVQALVAQASQDFQPDFGLYARLAWGIVTSAFVVGLYIHLGFGLMDVMAQTGLQFSGSGSEHIAPGQLGMYADKVTKSVDLAVEKIYGMGFFSAFTYAIEIFWLRFIHYLVILFFGILALINFIIMVRYMIGFLMGMMTIGAFVWPDARTYALKSISYAFFSGLPILALAFVQGLVILLVDRAIMPDGVPASPDVLTDIAVTLVIACIVAALIPSIAKEYMFSMVGGGGVPDVQSIGRTTGSVGAGVASTMNAAGQIGSSIGKSLGGSGGGGGISIVPPPGGWGSSAGAPKLSLPAAAPSAASTSQNFTMKPKRR